MRTATCCPRTRSASPTTNTVLRTVAGTLVTLFVSFSAAYALARRTLPLNKTITLLMIFTMFFSGGLIATYLWMGQMGLHNNRLALILPPAASAYYIIIMRNFFRAIPPELEESAFMDGASAYTVLLRIVVPVSMPVVATIALWSAVFHWDSWFDAMLYTPKREQLAAAADVAADPDRAPGVEPVRPVGRRTREQLRGGDDQGGDVVYRHRPDYTSVPVPAAVLRQGNHDREPEGVTADRVPTNDGSGGELDMPRSTT